MENRYIYFSFNFVELKSLQEIINYLDKGTISNISHEVREDIDKIKSF